METLIILCFLSFGLFFQVISTSDCPHSDPDCHPLCIEYVGPCKYCRCKGGLTSGSESNSHSGSSSINKWNSNFMENSNKFEEEYTGKEQTNREEDNSNTKVIIIHETDTQTKELTSLPGLTMGGQMPFNIPHGPMTAQNPFPQYTSSSGNTINVPLKSPGIPKYCVSIDKMQFEDCSCTVVDEGGCQTCPCFSASRFWIAVKTKESKPQPKEKKECVGTMLCMMSCQGGYHLGETGPDGCQSCTCLKKTENSENTTPMKEKETECPKVYECILKCSERKLGFTVGEKTSGGCRSCKCTGDENINAGGGSNSWTTGGSEMMGNSNGGGGDNNYLKSPDKGVGTSGGNEAQAKCNPPMVQCTNDGNTLMQTMAGGSGSTGVDGGGTSGGAGGPFNPMGGGSGSGSPFNPSSGGSGSGGGMKSPFAGGGPGTGMGGGPGMGGMGPKGPQTPGFPSEKKVEETAYNENCFGPSCSAKNGGLVDGLLQNDLLMGNFRK